MLTINLTFLVSSLKCHANTGPYGTGLIYCPKEPTDVSKACIISKMGGKITKYCGSALNVDGLKTKGLTQIPGCLRKPEVIRCACDTNGCNVDELLEKGSGSRTAAQTKLRILGIIIVSLFKRQIFS